MPKLALVGKSKHHKKIAFHCGTQISWWTSISIGWNFSTLFIPDTSIQFVVGTIGSAAIFFVSHNTKKIQKWLK